MDEYYSRNKRALSASMQIIVRTPQGASAVVQISKDATIGALKHAIEDSEYLPVNQQRLVCNDEQMDDELILADCLEETDVVTLFYDLEGGSHGGSRYKKSTSCMRWKWRKKRTRRLQRKRRKMRMRAR